MFSEIFYGKVGKEPCKAVLSRLCLVFDIKGACVGSGTECW